MRKQRAMGTNLSTTRELIAFVWRGKTWWLTPMIVVLLLLTGVVIFLEASAIAPFIYALF
jgi:hypothetical protein